MMRVACLLLLGGAAGFVAPASRTVGARARARTAPSSTVSYVDAPARDEPTVLPDPWWFRALEVRWSAADQLQGTPPSCSRAATTLDAEVRRKVLDVDRHHLSLLIPEEQAIVLRPIDPIPTFQYEATHGCQVR